MGKKISDAERILQLEAENADLKCSEASVTDLANTYCREHQLPESGEPKDGINQLAWKCTRLEQENAALRDVCKALILDLSNNGEVYGTDEARIQLLEEAIAKAEER